MAIARSNRSKGFWFGTERKMGWFPTPNRGADMSPEGWGESGVLLNGGGYNFASFGSHKNYQFEWPGTSSREVAQLMKAYADGTYGRGLIYFQDCLMFETNVLPARVADPSMTIGYEGTSLVHGVEPTAVPQTSGVNNLPVYGARYNLNRAYVGFRKGGGAVFVPIPEGYNLVFGAIYESSGSGGVFLTEQDELGNIGATTQAKKLPQDTTTFAGDIVSGSGIAGVWVWVGKLTSAASTLTLSAMSARLLPVEESSKTFVARNYFTNPLLQGSGVWREFRRNACVNPSFESGSITNWGSNGNLAGATITVHSADTHGGAYSARVRCAGAEIGEGINRSAAYPMTLPGGVATVSCWVKAAEGTQIRMALQQRNTSNALIDVKLHTITASGEWERMWVTRTDLVAGNRVTPAVYSPVATPAEFLVDDFLVEWTDQLLPYFGGDFTEDPDARSRFVGTSPVNEESSLEGEIVRGFDFLTAGAYPFVSTYGGKPAIRLVPFGTGGAPRATTSIPSSVRGGGVLVGTLTVAEGRTGGGNANNPSLAVNAPLLTSGRKDLPGTYPLRVEFDALASPFEALFYALGYKGNPDVYWTDIGVLSKGATSNSFSGDTVEEGFGFEWEGAPGNSPSVKFTVPPGLEAKSQGPWQPGQGHSGCRFEGKPTFIANGPFNGGHVGFAATFREVGSWTNG